MKKSFSRPPTGESRASDSDFLKKWSRDQLLGSNMNAFDRFDTSSYSPPHTPDIPEGTVRLDLMQSELPDVSHAQEQSMERTGDFAMPSPVESPVRAREQSRPCVTESNAENLSGLFEGDTSAVTVDKWEKANILMEANAIEDNETNTRDDVDTMEAIDMALHSVLSDDVAHVSTLVAEDIDRLLGLEEDEVRELPAPREQAWSALHLLHHDQDSEEMDHWLGRSLDINHVPNEAVQCGNQDMADRDKQSGGGGLGGPDWEPRGSYPREDLISSMDIKDLAREKARMETSCSAEHMQERVEGSVVFGYHDEEMLDEEYQAGAIASQDVSTDRYTSNDLRVNHFENRSNNGGQAPLSPVAEQLSHPLGTPAKVFGLSSGNVGENPISLNDPLRSRMLEVSAEIESSLKTKQVGMFVFSLVEPLLRACYARMQRQPGGGSWGSFVSKLFIKLRRTMPR